VSIYKISRRLKAPRNDRQRESLSLGNTVVPAHSYHCGSGALPLVWRIEMNDNPWFRLIVLFCLLSWLSGCAHVISSQERSKARKDLSFSTILANPEAYQGETVVWGGKVIDTVNEESLALIKVLQIPLDYFGMPEDEEMSQGRFIAEVQRYVDPEIYRKGRMITLAGEILGKKVEPLGEMEYTYPLVRVKEIHLWKQYSSPYGPYPPPYWYYWFGYPYPYAWPYDGPYFRF
jgi:outer membrane lipoprotein